jgi:radical SAM protein with 4Fe4S-binding SPASM domain
MTTTEYLNLALIEMTHYCNLHCVHCYNHSYATEQGSYKKAFRLLNHLIRKTTVKHLTFTGGEPCVSERFTEIVLHAKLQGKSVSVITNGNGPTEVYRQLARMKVERVSFSIHSSQPEIHNRITRVAGSWEKAVGNMKFMIENGIPVTPVIVITSLNYEDITATIRYFHQQGINRIMVNRYNLGGEGLKHRHLPTTAPQLRDAFRQIDDYAGKHDINIYSGVCTPYCLLNPDDYPHIRFGACSEDVYRRPLTFDLDGNLRLCNHSPVYAGNIYKQSLTEIFANPYLSEWDDLDMAFCKNCTRLQQCKGGCRAASEQMGQSLKNEDPILHTLNISPLYKKKEKSIV